MSTAKWQNIEGSKKFFIYYALIMIFDKIHTSVQSSDGFLLFLNISSAALPSDLHSSGVDTGPYHAFNQGMNLPKNFAFSSKRKKISKYL